ncbi:MAG TPA: putative peptidoglycan glycosyltransferase FtsW, partial [Candidatus Saccharimonadales bacterium]|nr:putative peptidoglycan glycosyltransferase FtsW [Candidatus Saccharimonadales bacterium]
TAIALGIIAFGIVAAVPLGTWRRLQRPLIGTAILASLAALVIPTTAEYPAHRWIRFGGLSLQSVELIKIALLVCFAAFLAQRIREGAIGDNKKTLQPILIVIGCIAAVVGIAQKDLGSLGVLVAMIAAMGFVAGLSLKRVLMGGSLIAIGAILLILPFSYRRDRVLTFLHPEKDCQNAGYQACQALIAVGSGGLIGKGLSQGAQSSGYLPEAANDSIFAIMAEKFGFVGVTLLICLFAALFSRIKNILERAPDNFSRLIVSGVLAWFSTQALINIGAMIGLLPLKGITLPFISYGGTSIIFVLAALGLVFQISRYTTFGVNTETEGKSHENTVDWRRDRRPYHANPSSRI